MADAILNSVIHRKRGLVEREWTQEMDSRLGSTTNFPWTGVGQALSVFPWSLASQVWGTSGPPSPEKAGHCHAPLLCNRWEPETRPLLRQHQFAKRNPAPFQSHIPGGLGRAPF